MLNQSDAEAILTAQVRVMQVIVAALVFGLLLFTGVGSFIAFVPRDAFLQDKDQGRIVGQAGEVVGGADGLIEGGQPVIAYFAVAMAAISIFARVIVPGMMVQNMVRTMFRGKSIESISKLQFVPIYQTSLIIASALLEGAAIFNVIALIIDHQILSLGIAASLIVLMGAGFPTVERVNSWTEEQLRDFQLNPPMTN